MLQVDVIPDPQPSQAVPFVPENAPFSAEQRAWLNGFLAGMYSQAPAPHAASAKTAATPLTILFGSQTGNAEALAKKTKKAAAAKGFEPAVVDMDEYDTAKIAEEENLLIITSTYGEGEPPDNAMAFFEFIHGNDAPKLEKLRYGVLGLGDSSYPDFNECAKRFDARLADLGAHRICEGVYCDVDFDDDYERWIEMVLANSDAAAERAIDVMEPEAEPQTPAYSRKNPFSAELKKNINLNGKDSAKETRHVEISLEGSGLSYAVGDALGVLPRNCGTLVDELLERLEFDGEEAVPGPDEEEISLRRALTEYYDISALSKQFVKEYAGVSEHDALVSMNQNGALDEYLAGRQLIDPLLDYPADFGSAAAFVALLKKLAPRLYSISSSPKAHPGEVHLTVGVVRYETHGRQRKGVCSNFLAELQPGEKTGVYIQPNKHFKPPQDDSRPMIMVGPGTGIAPFRAFLEERQATGAKGNNWLFFGDQKSSTDFLYREQIEQMHASGFLQRLDTAFSRDQKKKIYVQNRMRENAKDLYAWLEEGGSFYVCGDASRMAKDVDAALHDTVREAGGLSEDNTKAYVEKLKKEKRYVRDVY